MGVMGCLPSKVEGDHKLDSFEVHEDKTLPSEVAETNLSHGHEDFSILASETVFTVSEVETLYELYKKLSTSIVKDGFIQKEELHFALFRNSNKPNLFVNRECGHDYINIFWFCTRLIRVI